MTKYAKIKVTDIPLRWMNFFTISKLIYKLSRQSSISYYKCNFNIQNLLQEGGKICYLYLHKVKSKIIRLIFRG